jgi:hypothetical protein
MIIVVVRHKPAAKLMALFKYFSHSGKILFSGEMLSLSLAPPNAVSLRRH